MAIVYLATDFPSGKSVAAKPITNLIPNRYSTLKKTNIKCLN